MPFDAAASALAALDLVLDLDAGQNERLQAVDVQEA